MKSCLGTVIVLACLSSAAAAADKRVFRIDSLIATQKNGTIQLQAKGAVPTGGWTKPRLHVMHGDSRTLTVEFLATSPPQGMTVIEALVPVSASLEVKGRAPSVRVFADQNEITSQVLK
ncbi:MAG TPA: hypothetical protein VJS47_01950 [Rhizomicrobium sp.]|nr:hypothetical protein [Rhizomicrobium sp.]